MLHIDAVLPPRDIIEQQRLHFARLLSLGHTVKWPQILLVRGIHPIEYTVKYIAACVHCTMFVKTCLLAIYYYVLYTNFISIVIAKMKPFRDFVRLPRHQFVFSSKHDKKQALIRSTWTKNISLIYKI